MREAISIDVDRVSNFLREGYSARLLESIYILLVVSVCVYIYPLLSLINGLLTQVQSTSALPHALHFGIQ
jgi:hypothetical protein